MDEIVAKNKEDLIWEKIELSGDSPVSAVLRVDPDTEARMIMIDLPSALHIPRHTHEKSETHIITGGIAPRLRFREYYREAGGRYSQLAHLAPLHSSLHYLNEAVAALRQGLP